MSTTFSTSSTSALQRASLPVPATLVDASPLPAVVERPPLEFKRPPAYEISQGRALWGSPHYQGVSSSIRDIGGDPFNVVASFIPVAELREVLDAEPEFRTSFLTDYLAATDSSHAARQQRAEASYRMLDAQDAIHSNRVDLVDVAVRSSIMGLFGSFGLGLGSVLLVKEAATAGGNSLLLGLGAAMTGTGGLVFLGAAGICIKGACTRRRAVQASQELAAARQADASSSLAFASANRAIDTAEIRLRGVDLTSAPSEVIVEMSSVAVLTEPDV